MLKQLTVIRQFSPCVLAAFCLRFGCVLRQTRNNSEASRPVWSFPGYKCSYTFKVIAGVETQMSLCGCIHHKQINTVTNVSFVCNLDILPDTRGLRFGQPRLVNVSRNFGSELFTSNASAFWICVLVCVLATFCKTSRNLAAFWNCVLKKHFTF